MDEHHHHHHNAEVIWVAFLFSQLHYHKSDLGLIANGHLSFSIINRSLPWPQAVIKAVIFSYSLKQCTRPEREPERQGGTERTFAHPIFL